MESTKNRSWALVLKKIDNYFAFFESILVTLTFFAMIALIFIQVLCRFVLKVSAPWTEELALLLFIVSTLLGAGCCLASGHHIEINIIGSMYQKIEDIDKRLARARVMDIIRYSVAVGVGVLMLVLGVEYTQNIFKIGSAAAATKIPMGYIYATAPYGFGMVAVHAFVKLILCFADFSLVVDPKILDGGMD